MKARWSLYVNLIQHIQLQEEHNLMECGHILITNDNEYEG